MRTSMLCLETKCKLLLAALFSAARYSTARRTYHSCGSAGGVGRLALHLPSQWSRTMFNQGFEMSVSRFTVSWSESS